MQLVAAHSSRTTQAKASSKQRHSVSLSTLVGFFLPPPTIQSPEPAGR